MPDTLTFIFNVKLGDQVIAKYTRLNEQIRAPRLRVIDSDGKQLGILSRQEALAIAQERELDLVEISPDADPPVCKVVDWGKYNYQRTKQLQKNRKSAKTLDLKQMRFGLKIGAHDLAIKMSKVTKFLEAGHKVKITLFYRGREQAHKEIGFKIAQEVIEDFGDTIIVDQQPQLSGKQLSFVIRSSGKKPAPQPVETSDIQEEEGES
ncbi:MAG TPA: translation initiation factor IF-3 [Candidatus Dormibacteraeota bacterium]|nr:translation initiation factor IF-3 [Candidatus Dormibacteraeota bacterium]